MSGTNYGSDPYTPEPQATLRQYLVSSEFLLTLGSVLLGGVLLVVTIFYVVLPWITNHNKTVDVPDVTSDPLKKRFVKVDEAFADLERSGLHPVVNDSQYYRDLPPLCVIRQEPVGLSIVKPGRTVYLVVNKRTPPSVKVPDVVDINLDQARSLLENWKLKVGRLTYTQGEYPNLVLKAQYRGRDLEKFEEVPEGSAIDLVVSRGHGPTRVELPNLVGLELQQAVSRLNLLGLRASVSYDEASKKTVGTVVNQSPRYGTQDSVYQNVVVYLTVAGSPDAAIEGPPPAESPADSSSGKPKKTAKSRDKND
jgi:beta-lactam-binding protein with PASTA domain